MRERVSEWGMLALISLIFARKWGSDAQNLCDFCCLWGETVLFLAVFRWLGGGRWLYSILSAFAADDGKSGFF